jgi:hypothetical protein
LNRVRRSLWKKRRAGKTASTGVFCAAGRRALQSTQIEKEWLVL